MLKPHKAPSDLAMYVSPLTPFRPHLLFTSPCSSHAELQATYTHLSTGIPQRYYGLGLTRKLRRPKLNYNSPKGGS